MSGKEVAKPSIVDDDDYDSASDEDFDPLDVDQQSGESSSSEDEVIEGKVIPAKRKQRVKHQTKIDDELDSGDEATIKERQKKKKRRIEQDSDDEGGAGGFVRTRAQRRVQQEERRPLARTDGATIDVNSVWARLASLPIGRPSLPIPAEESAKEPAQAEEYITIKRSTKFAGETVLEERKVLKRSKEAQLYIQEQEALSKSKAKDGAAEQQVTTEDQLKEEVAPARPNIRRPLRRPSRFEPNPLGEVKGLPPHLQLRWPRDKPSALALQDNRLMPPPPRPLQGATKLNTVQKSKQDWAGYVDKAGIAEELDEHGRSKGSYLSRTDFLDRMEMRREDERLRVKAKVS